MRTARHDTRTARSGLTLIELLVVMAIITTVAGLTILLIPRLQSETASRGAQDLQGSLMQAKYRALRDKAPRGIRLIPDPSDSTKIRGYAFIEQPAPWFAGMIFAPAQASTTTTIYTVSIPNDDLSNGLGTSDKSLWPVQPGDYLYVNKILRGRVQSVTTTTITVVGDPLATAITATADWYVARSPRPIAGEEVVNFPEGVAVDLGPYWGPAPPSDPTYTPFLTNVGQPTGPYDILFSPSGTVSGRYAGQGQIYLWLRDTNRDQNDPGEQIVIVVYTRTGQIGQYPLDTTAGQHPLSFRNDPKFRPSGL